MKFCCCSHYLPQTVKNYRQISTFSLQKRNRLILRPVTAQAVRIEDSPFRAWHYNGPAIRTLNVGRRVIWVYSITSSGLRPQSSEGTIGTTWGLVAWDTAVDAVVVVLTGSCVAFGETGRKSGGKMNYILLVFQSFHLLLSSLLYNFLEYFFFLQKL